MKSIYSKNRNIKNFANLNLLHEFHVTETQAVSPVTLEHHMLHYRCVLKQLHLCNLLRTLTKKQYQYLGLQSGVYIFLPIQAAFSHTRSSILYNVLGTMSETGDA